MSWKKRILRDIGDLASNGFTVRGDTSDEIDDASCFLVDLIGPKETLYEGVKYTVRFTISEGFPFKSPSVGFVEHVVHPNVDFASGSICLDALNSKWSPCFTIRHVMESLLPYLLTYPNPEDPLNRDAAVLLKNDLEEYKRQVRAAVLKFGKPV